jgi:uroporphyrinogen decarboxylase
MSHRARIEAALANLPTDRTPLSFWWHWANKDRSPRRLAELAVHLQQQLDMDFIKFSPYGLYSVVDWGVQLNVQGGENPILAESPIRKADDWLKIKPVRSDAGEYLIVLEAQRIALEMLNGDVPFVQHAGLPQTSTRRSRSDHRN